MKDELVQRQPVSLWSNRDYLLLWSGQVVSSVGSQVSQLAFPLLILALTASPAQAGLAGALRALPYFIFSLPAGALIDRWNRKRVMILCDVGRALSLATIPLTLFFGHVTVLQLYLVSLIEGTLFVFFNIAEAACLPRVVSKEQLPAATAQNVITYDISALLGSPLGGTLYSLSHVFPFLADAISYSLSVISLLFIKTEFQGEREKQGFTPYKLWREIREGLLWLWKQPLIRFMAVLTSGYNLVTSGAILLVIVLAQRLHASAFTIGLVFSIGGIGGILGAWPATLIQKRFSFGKVIIGISWFVTLLFPLYIFAPNVLALGVITAAISLAFPSYDVVQFSYRSALIPDKLQGRVNSVFRLIAFGGQPLGFALTGILIQTLNVVPTILIFSACLLALALAATFNPYVRNARPVTELANRDL